jgi:hypothetical protein
VNKFIRDQGFKLQLKTRAIIIQRYEQLVESLQSYVLENSAKYALVFIIYVPFMFIDMPSSWRQFDK